MSSKCAACGSSGKGGEGNAAISKYGPAGPASKKPYAREGAAPFKALLYESDVAAPSRGYAADPTTRYRLPYANMPHALGLYTPGRGAMERYKPPQPLVPFKARAELTDADMFRKLDAMDMRQRSGLVPGRPQPFILEDLENLRKKYRVQGTN